MRPRGFSLLEMLVAFAIMAMSLGLLYRAAGSSAVQTRDLELRQHALWLAESLLNIHNTVDSGGWNESGEEVGYHWHVSSQPYDSPLPPAQGGVAPLIPPVKLHAVHIAVQWDMGSRPSQVELGTLLPERPPRPGEVVK